MSSRLGRITPCECSCNERWPQPSSGTTTASQQSGLAPILKTYRSKDYKRFTETTTNPITPSFWWLGNLTNPRLWILLPENLDLSHDRHGPWPSSTPPSLFRTAKERSLCDA